MRILEESSDKSVNNIILYLTASEASEMRDGLDELLEKPLNNHVHVSNKDFTKEVTICIYDTENLIGLQKIYRINQKR